jgi:methyl-accepting chemotaxis protein
MDEVTQQNSALVEESAAAAKVLEQQSKAMDHQVGMFRLGDAPAAGHAPPVAALKPAADPRQRAAAKQSPAQPKRGVVGRMQAALATAFKPEPGWKEF